MSDGDNAPLYFDKGYLKQRANIGQNRFKTISCSGNICNVYAYVRIWL